MNNDTRKLKREWPGNRLDSDGKSLYEPFKVWACRMAKGASEASKWANGWLKRKAA